MKRERNSSAWARFSPPSRCTSTCKSSTASWAATAAFWAPLADRAAPVAALSAAAAAFAAASAASLALQPLQDLLDGLVEPFPEVAERLAHRPERLGLGGRQLPQAVEEEAVGQFVVGLDLAAEEVAEGRGQQRRPGRRGRAQQPGQVRVGAGQGVGDPGHGPPRLLDQPLRVGVSCKAGRLAGDVRGRSALRGQQPRLAEPLQLVEAGLAELGGRPVEGDGVALQEELHLLADALVVAGGEEDLDAVHQPIAGQGDAEGLPGPVVGLIQRFRQRPAVIAEPLLDHLNDRHNVFGGVADHLPQPEADQLTDE